MCTVTLHGVLTKDPEFVLDLVDKKEIPTLKINILDIGEPYKKRKPYTINVRFRHSSAYLLQKKLSKNTEVVVNGNLCAEKNENNTFKYFIDANAIIKTGLHIKVGS